MRREELFELAHENGIKIIQAKSKDDQYTVAIHLLNPSLDEVEGALDRAMRDLFPAIVIHSHLTWPGSA